MPSESVPRLSSVFKTFPTSTPHKYTRNHMICISNHTLTQLFLFSCHKEGIIKTVILHHTAVPRGFNKLPLGLHVAGPDQVTGLVGPQCLYPLHHGKPHDLLYARGLFYINSCSK